MIRCQSSVSSFQKAFADRGVTVPNRQPLPLPLPFLPLLCLVCVFDFRGLFYFSLLLAKISLNFHPMVCEMASPKSQKSGKNHIHLFRPPQLFPLFSKLAYLCRVIWGSHGQKNAHWNNKFWSLTSSFKTCLSPPLIGPVSRRLLLTTHASPQPRIALPGWSGRSQRCLWTLAARDASKYAVIWLMSWRSNWLHGILMWCFIKTK